ncbi:class I SAM-dependent methyltransferase [Candidatus Micrarchaeota archaeon]|nr:class I SAM-dependent methyltransferase [Candidatus Micrarchaeota archaeon]
MGKSHGWKQYPRHVANAWDSFIDWRRRKRGERSFFIQHLRRMNAVNVLDVACGTGYDSIRLAKEGFEVTSLDASPHMLERAKYNAAKERVILRCVRADWKKLDSCFKPASFHAVIFLGNSFTHLFDRPDRESVLSSIHRLLKTRGMLIIDHRNYDMILDTGYKSKHKFVYCGENFEVIPVVRRDDLIRFSYFGKKHHWFLDIYPIRTNEMLELLANAGFSKIETFGDFERPFAKYGADFIQHVAIKK